MAKKTLSPSSYTSRIRTVLSRSRKFIFLIIFSKLFLVILDNYRRIISLNSFVLYRRKINYDLIEYELKVRIKEQVNSRTSVEGRFGCGFHRLVQQNQYHAIRKRLPWFWTRPQSFKIPQRSERSNFIHIIFFRFSSMDTRCEQYCSYHIVSYYLIER